MKWKAACLISLVGALTFAFGCKPSSANHSTDTPEFRDAMQLYEDGEYWNGEEFAGRPVYSLTRGISREAHDAFVKCALSGPKADRWIRTFVADNLPMDSGDTKKQVLQARNTMDDVLWSVAISVTKLSNDVYLVACSGKIQ